MNDNNDKDVHYSCENPVCLGLIDYEKSHYFWIKSKRPSDTGGFLREQYIILQKIIFKTRLSALKSDESQFFFALDKLKLKSIIFWSLEGNVDLFNFFMIFATKLIKT